MKTAVGKKESIKMDDAEDGSNNLGQKTNNNQLIRKSDSLHFLRADNFLRMSDLRAGDLTKSNRSEESKKSMTNRTGEVTDALRLSESLSLIKSNEINRTKTDGKKESDKKMLPDDLRTNRTINNNNNTSNNNNSNNINSTGSGNGVPLAGSVGQQSRNNISFSVASLLADTRPRKSPSVYHSESPSPTVCLYIIYYLLFKSLICPPILVIPIIKQWEF
ncbi:hypothetical protein RUM44_001816 [Polyplax serrata]|uniref:Uncharacterized protein n=1 Tax=Polyplax serrata TaxID=468196 RepID=A0ABR1ALE7_POLSC